MTGYAMPFSVFSYFKAVRPATSSTAPSRRVVIFSRMTPIARMCLVLGTKPM